MENEIWQNVVNTDGNYQISNLGRIKSVSKINYLYHGGHYLKNGKILKPWISKKGYYRIRLDKKYVKSKISTLVHRLVAEAFIEKIQGKNLINHKNGIKTDNRVENLEWCNNSENVKHSFQIGLQKKLRGGQSKSSKKINQYDENDVLIKKYDSLTEAANELKISISRISNCCNSKINHAGGYKWRFSKF